MPNKDWSLTQIIYVDKTHNHINCKNDHQLDSLEMLEKEN